MSQYFISFKFERPVVREIVVHKHGGSCPFCAGAMTPMRGGTVHECSWCARIDDAQRLIITKQLADSIEGMFGAILEQRKAGQR